MGSDCLVYYTQVISLVSLTPLSPIAFLFMKFLVVSIISSACVDPTYYLCLPCASKTCLGVCIFIGSCVILLLQGCCLYYPYFMCWIWCKVVPYLLIIIFVCCDVRAMCPRDYFLSSCCASIW